MPKGLPGEALRRGLDTEGQPPEHIDQDGGGKQQSRHTPTFFSTVATEPPPMCTHHPEICIYLRHPSYKKSQWSQYLYVVISSGTYYDRIAKRPHSWRQKILSPIFNYIHLQVT